MNGNQNMNGNNNFNNFNNLNQNNEPTNMSKPVKNKFFDPSMFSDDINDVGGVTSSGVNTSVYQNNMNNMSNTNNSSNTNFINQNNPNNMALNSGFNDYSNIDTLDETGAFTPNYNLNNSPLFQGIDPGTINNMNSNSSLNSNNGMNNNMVNNQGFTENNMNPNINNNQNSNMIMADSNQQWMMNQPLSEQSLGVNTSNITNDTIVNENNKFIPPSMPAEVNNNPVPNQVVNQGTFKLDDNPVSGINPMNVVKAFVGDKFSYFKRAPFNFCACIFFINYFFYRKMYLLGIAANIIITLVFLVSPILALIISPIAMVISGLTFNKIYLNNAYSKCKTIIENSNGNEMLAINTARSKGGGHIGSLILGVVIVNIIMTIFTFIMPSAFKPKFADSNITNPDSNGNIKLEDIKLKTINPDLYFSYELNKTFVVKPEEGLIMYGDKDCAIRLTKVVNPSSFDDTLNVIGKDVGKKFNLDNVNGLLWNSSDNYGKKFNKPKLIELDDEIILVNYEIGGTKLKDNCTIKLDQAFKSFAKKEE